MNHEDAVTLNAFLVAATRLETPLPENLQHQLDAIAKQFPASIYELHEFVEQYSPLKQQYIAALQTLPGEGERPKFADPSTLERLPAESTVSWEEVEQQLGTYFKDMVLDFIERSHPDYEPKMAEALSAALIDMEQRPTITVNDIDAWITNLFASSNTD
ncbi:MAG: hypothetical protein VKJ24_21625 [Synechococcales bacterium]|nr:hypothetical protein [Synechococcales bacterium]